MKQDTHPDNFRKVIFHDTTSGEEFLFSSTVETDETGEYEGEEYPLTRIEMSSASHPFYTGVEKVVDTAGRVEKFNARFEKSQEKQQQAGGEGKQEEDESNSGDQAGVDESATDDSSAETDESTDEDKSN